MRSIEELERGLQGPEPGELSAPLDLAGIRRAGLRRRRGHRALTASAGVMAALALVGGVYAVTDGPGTSGMLDGSVASDPDPSPTPTALSPLAERVLREIPGAVQVSAWQVVIPAPNADSLGDSPVRDLVGDPVALPAHQYTGVTTFPEEAFPGWLYDAVRGNEEENAESDGSMAVGTTSQGVLVDVGPAQLGCTRRSSEPLAGASCAPTVLHSARDRLVLDYSLGSDDFLAPGAPMEVFVDDDYSTGAPTTIAIAGIDGVDVATVDFLATDGSVVPGTVQSGSIAEGDSLFFANVPGTLARVVAYDDTGEVIEDHKLRDCTSPVNCEVR